MPRRRNINESRDRGSQQAGPASGPEPVILAGDAVSPGSTEAPAGAPAGDPPAVGNPPAAGAGGPSAAARAGTRTVEPAGRPGDQGAGASAAPDGGASPGEASFEEMLAELEAIVTRLESGDEPLDRALALFQRGIGLVRRCNQLLDAMERKIQWLLEDAAGTVVTREAPELEPAAAEGEGH
ncbi:exodeoxyribonuclease VII small subunit [Thermaerobacter subterraneus]|uniref:Exodeoxyribonuclease 7 small subunit n=1 Tax=Thermaerobacter subterraneus DSM 13965 TaxID=867903 RepID=K6PLT2_9FIRM|nr:Exodeoxyribonuclease VII small subunit [Thermaerobacter subterraneus DSM 13965]